MKEHESRRSVPGDRIYYYSTSDTIEEIINPGVCWGTAKGIENYYLIDSNNFLHDLDGRGYMLFIHGVRFKDKGEYDKEVNRIKMIDEIWS